jgi:hypothetical protein
MIEVGSTAIIFSNSPAEILSIKTLNTPLVIVSTSISALRYPPSPMTARKSSFFLILGCSWVPQFSKKPPNDQGKLGA